jgi:hypothetical protein
MMDRKTWPMRILEATRDLANQRYQERVWVRGEGPEVDSSTEALSRLLDDYDLAGFIAEAAEKGWISNEQLAVLRRLDAALARDAINGENAADARMIQTRRWQKIRKLALTTLEAFTTPAASA